MSLKFGPPENKSGPQDYEGLVGHGLTWKKRERSARSPVLKTSQARPARIAVRDKQVVRAMEVCVVGAAIDVGVSRR
ncbi:MAG: hypothetical protein ACXWUB_02530, partial [Burkholderiales bacterium]